MLSYQSTPYTTEEETLSKNLEGNFAQNPFLKSDFTNPKLLQKYHFKPHRVPIDDKKLYRYFQAKYVHLKQVIDYQLTKVGNKHAMLSNPESKALRELETEFQKQTQIFKSKVSLYKNKMALKTMISARTKKNQENVLNGDNFPLDMFKLVCEPIRAEYQKDKENCLLLGVTQDELDNIKEEPSVKELESVLTKIEKEGFIKLLSEKHDDYFIPEEFAQTNIFYLNFENSSQDPREYLENFFEEYVY